MVRKLYAKGSVLSIKKNVHLKTQNSLNYQNSRINNVAYIFFLFEVPVVVLIVVLPIPAITNSFPHILQVNR